MITRWFSKKMVLLLAVSYLVLLSGLLYWIAALQPPPTPEVTQFAIDKHRKELVVTGKNLSKDLDAVIAATAKQDQGVLSHTHTWGDAYDVKIKGSTAWVANNSGLLAYNLSAPENPQQLSSMPLPGQSWKLEIQGDYAFVISPQDGITIINICDADNPKLISTIRLPGPNHAVAFKGNYLLVAAGKKGLHVIDIREVTQPTLITSLPLEGYQNTISINGNMGYVGGRRGKNSQGESAGILYQVDLSNPASPKQIHEIELPSAVLHLKEINQRVYIGTTNGVYLVELEQANTTPRVIIPKIMVANWIQKGNQLYIVERSSNIYILDLSAPEQNKFTTLATHHQNCRAMALYGPVAIMARSQSGLSVIDITQAATTCAPLLSLPQKDRKLKQLTIQDNRIFIEDFKSLHLAYCSEEGYRFYATLSFPDSIKKAIYRGDFAYLAIKNRGLVVVDLRPEENEENRLLTTLPLVKNIRFMELDNNRLYVCLPQQEIQVLDISTPQAPVVLFNEKIAVDAQAITVKDNLAYVATASRPNGLEIYSLMEGKAPTRLARMVYPKPLDDLRIKDLKIQGKILYMATMHGMITVDISSPARPEIADSIRTAAPTDTIQLVEEKAFLHLSTRGLGMVDIRTPRALKMLYETDKFRDLTLAQGKIFTLEAGELNNCDQPRLLKKTQLSSTQARFQLPSVQAQYYDLHLSTAKTPITVKQALAYDEDKGWQILHSQPDN